MSENVYSQLADALDRLPNGFPRTKSGVEIPILKRIFSPEEAHIGSKMGHEMESADVIGKRAELSAEEARKMLMQMVRRGLVWFSRQEKGAFFRLAPFVVGIYEAQLEQMDHELAHVFEHYMAEGGADRGR